jgi:glyoxylase-like metal-dependent hydrolase (beta-lactamase superfamily II)
MVIEKLIVGQLTTNCYLVWNNSREVLIIDPGDDAGYIISKILDLKLVPKLILATHGHFDHVIAVTELKLAFNIPFLLAKKDLFLIKEVPQSAEYFVGFKADPVTLPDKFLKNDEIIKIGDIKLKVIGTPGHTPGGICLLGSGVLFSGDTLFADSVGRCDFHYGSQQLLNESLRKILKLPESTVVYPGHGEETTIKKVKQWFIPDLSKHV